MDYLMCFSGKGDGERKEKMEMVKEMDKEKKEKERYKDMEKVEKDKEEEMVKDEKNCRIREDGVDGMESGVSRRMAVLV